MYPARKAAELGAVRRQFGYRRHLILLRHDGPRVNHKKTALSRRTPPGGRRKRALRTRAALTLPKGPNQRWSLDFLSDQLSDSRRYRVLAVVDDFMREGLTLVGGHLAFWCSYGTRTRSNYRGGAQAAVDCAATTTPISPAWRTYAGRKRNRSTGIISRQASHQNAFIESFNAAELLNETLFASLDHTHESLWDWKDDYNTVRPNSALGNVPPTVNTNLSDPTTQRDGSLELHEGSAPRPIASPSH